MKERILVLTFYKIEEMTKAFERLKEVAAKVKEEKLGGLKDAANYDGTPLEEALYEGSQFRY